MKKLTQISALLLGLMLVFTGCDAAQNAASGVAGQAGEMAGGLAEKGMDMAGIDFGGFDIGGLKEKFTGVTEGLGDVNADNVDGLTEKISGLGDSVDEMGAAELPGPAKTAVGGIISAFKTTVTTAMDGISDEGILGKLKPAVDGLMEKLDAFAG